MSNSITFQEKELKYLIERLVAAIPDKLSFLENDVDFIVKTVADQTYLKRDEYKPTPTGVTSINDKTGAIKLEQGSNVNIESTPTGIKISAVGEGSGSGADGFSPTVEIQEGDSQHTIIITDKDGPKTFTIKDGKDGQQGTPGEPGPKGDNGKNIIIAESNYNRNFNIDQWKEYTQKPQEKFFEITNSNMYKVGDSAIIKGTIENTRSCFVIGEVVTIGDDSSLTIKKMVFISDGLVTAVNINGQQINHQDGVINIPIIDVTQDMIDTIISEVITTRKQK